MGKIVWVLVLFSGMFAYSDGLESRCLACHKAQQIPNDLIYRRYLLKYSTAKNIENAMYRYLKNPQKEHSIMPPQFFLKFPMKKALLIPEPLLRQNILNFIDTFDVKKKLRIK